MFTFMSDVAYDPDAWLAWTFNVAPIGIVAKGPGDMVAVAPPESAMTFTLLTAIVWALVLVMAMVAGVIEISSA